MAIGAAGAAVPASRELAMTAAERLGLKQREERHWGSFFLGLLLGAVGGAVVALLTTPKRGSEMRHELATRADELASKARETEWVPIFERESNGHAALSGTTVAPTATSLEDAATEAGAATGETADQAAADAAEAINESYEPVDRESTT
jgi:gas vesicle protein